MNVSCSPPSNDSTHNLSLFLYNNFRLYDLGALDVHRSVQIVGECVTKECSLGDCVLDDGNDEKSDKDDSFSTATSTSDTKIIHFQRHGQGYHNLICDMWREAGKPIDFDSSDPNLNPVVRPEFLDPPLTALGMQQCSSQRGICAGLNPELVIVSPMLRCIQTARLSFRDHLNDVEGREVPWVSHEGVRLCASTLRCVCLVSVRLLSHLHCFIVTPQSVVKSWDFCKETRDDLLMRFKLIILTSVSFDK